MLCFVFYNVILIELANMSKVSVVLPTTPMHNVDVKYWLTKGHMLLPVEHCVKPDCRWTKIATINKCKAAQFLSLEGEILDLHFSCFWIRNRSHQSSYCSLHEAIFSLRNICIRIFKDNIYIYTSSPFPFPNRPEQYVQGYDISGVQNKKQKRQ